MKLLPEIYPNEKLLLQVIHDLREFMPFFVLVGGWVPFIYAKYVWGNISNLAVNTSDIDFGVLNKEYKGIETITSRVKKLGYGERHISMDRLIPFTPVIKSKVREIRLLIKYENTGKEVLSNIHKYFSNMDSKGPIFIEQENGPDSFIKNIREDAFKRITQLLI